MGEKKGKNTLPARNQQAALTLPYWEIWRILKPQGRGHAGVVAVDVRESRNRLVIIYPEGEVGDVDRDLLPQGNMLVRTALDGGKNAPVTPALVLLEQGQRQLIRVLHPHAAVAFGAHRL